VTQRSWATRAPAIEIGWFADDNRALALHSAYVMAKQAELAVHSRTPANVQWSVIAGIMAYKPTSAMWRKQPDNTSAAILSRVVAGVAAFWEMVDMAEPRAILDSPQQMMRSPYHHEAAYTESDTGDTRTTRYGDGTQEGVQKSLGPNSRGGCYYQGLMLST